MNGVFLTESSFSRFLPQPLKRARITALYATNQGLFNIIGLVFSRISALASKKTLNQKLCIKDKNPRDSRGLTPLHYAAQSNYLHIYKMISENLALKNPPSYNGHTPLHSAVVLGQIETVRYILKVVDDENLNTWSYMSPLHWAAMVGHLDNCARH